MSKLMAATKENQDLEFANMGLKDLLLTDEQVTAPDLDPNTVFEVAIDEDVIGLVFQTDFKSFLEANPDHYANTYVRTMGQEGWIPVVQHPLLQRRKPTLVKKNQISADERFYLFKDGQKVGPFNAEELKGKVEKKEILITEMLVPEKGGNWFKLFELNTFDRRFMTQEAGHLPEKPALELIKSHPHKKHDGQFEQKDAIAGLAYIGHLKNGKISEAKDHVVLEEGETISEMPKRGNEVVKKVFKYLLILSLLAGAGAFVYYKNLDSGFLSLGTDETTNTKGTTEEMVAPVLKPIKVLPNARRVQPNRRPSSIVRPQGVSPIKSSNFYRQQREEQLNYTQGNEPVENDPINSQLSEETLNPQPLEQQPQQSENWVSPEALQPQNPSENPFDAEVSY